MPHARKRKSPSRYREAENNTQRTKRTRVPNITTVEQPDSTTHNKDETCHRQLIEDVISGYIPTITKTVVEALETM